MFLGRFFIALLLPVSVFASPGEADKHGCHRDANDVRYHCHEQTSSYDGHAFIGIISANDLWLYNNGPLNFFSGVGLAAEYAFPSIGARASYRFLPHRTGADDYRLYGWDLALKAGYQLSQPGLGPYLEIGYFRQTFLRANNISHGYGGMQIGAGLMWSAERFAIDAKLISRSKNSLEAIWTELGAPGVSAHLHGQVGAYLRF